MERRLLPDMRADAAPFTHRSNSSGVRSRSARTIARASQTAEDRGIQALGLRAMQPVRAPELLPRAPQAEENTLKDRQLADLLDREYRKCHGVLEALEVEEKVGSIEEFGSIQPRRLHGGGSRLAIQVADILPRSAWIGHLSGHRGVA